MNLLMRIISLIFLLCVIAIIILIIRLPPDMVIVIGGTILGMFVVGLGGVLVLLFLIGWQRYQGVKADTDKKKLEANTLQSGGEIWVREEIKQIENGKQTITVEFARLGGVLQRINSHSHNPTEADRLLAMTQITTGQTKMLASGQIIPQLPPPTELFSLLDKADRVLVKGASDAGKTTILQHIAQRSNGVFIIDPHFAPGIWPVARNRIVGAGRDYPAIDKFLAQLMVEVNGRYLHRAKGETNFEPITLIIDEFNSIRAECDQAGKIISVLIRESRKVQLRLFIGSHSELVKPLGLEGQGDVREGLLIVRLSVDQITKQRVCKVDDGNGERDCWFPPFGGMGQPLSLPAAPVIIQPPDEDREIIELANQGLSYKEVTEAIYGPGKYGKFYNDKIDKILARYGLRIAPRIS